MNEPKITINGQPLTDAQAMTLRVAIGSYTIDMSETHALGEDASGERLRKEYLARLQKIQQLLVSPATPG